MSLIYSLKEIPQLKIRIQDLIDELNDFDGYSKTCLKEIGGERKINKDVRMMNILERRERSRETLQAVYEKYLAKLNESMMILEEIEDIKTRNIFNARYIQEKTWNQVVKTIGGNSTVDSVKKIHDRYLKKISKTTIKH